MQDMLKEYHDFSSFKKDTISRLFGGFRKDYYICKDSLYLVKRMKRKEFEKMKNFILRGMQ